MKILYIGEIITHDEYLKGNVPSHWLYGAVEMERDGHDVVWASESNQLLNDYKLIRGSKPDCIFIPNLNIRNHLLLLILVYIGVIRIPVYAYLHHEPPIRKKWHATIYKILLKRIKHLFFLSEKSREAVINSGVISENKTSVPGWGADKEFYDRIETTSGKWFVSTGKENRDFDILIEAFRKTEAPLHIITAHSHANKNYDDLINKCRDIPNIKVTLIENSPTIYPKLIKEMAAAKALVCPLIKENLNYCVGLSTIADAEGLNKPLIITENAYHGSRPQKDNFYSVENVEQWVDAINSINCSNHRVNRSPYSMQKTYQNMARIMDL